MRHAQFSPGIFRRHDREIVRFIAHALIVGLLASVLSVGYALIWSTSYSFSWSDSAGAPPLQTALRYLWWIPLLGGVVHPLFPLVNVPLVLGLAALAALSGQWWFCAVVLVVGVAGTGLVGMTWQRFHLWLLRHRAPLQQQGGGRSMEPQLVSAQQVGAATGGLRLAKRPMKDFNSIIGMAAVKADLLEAGRKAQNSGGTPLNGILLHGEPGNGKTSLAEALAGELKLPWISVSVSDIVSRWVGQAPEEMRAIFDAARASTPCVLFVDECESILASRDGAAVTADKTDLVNVFLTEAVKLRGSGVVLVAATNYLHRLDTAAIRDGRFDFKVEVTPPDEEARLGLLAEGIRQHAGQLSVPDELLQSAARRWVGFSVARLVAVSQRLHEVMSGRRVVEYADLLAALRKVQGAASRVAEGTKGIDDLVLGAQQGQQIRSIAKRIKDAFEIERLGGSAPNGVLFYGPPGTGKTEAARALARETGCAFITTSGNDLLSQAGALDEVYKRAKDMRPALVFIDEADDVLADRSYSSARSITNKLLTIMDGVGGKVPDIVFLAATNHPSTLDQAVLRGGRFTEKVEFLPPSEDQIQAYAVQWLGGRNWGLDAEALGLLGQLRGQSIANVTAVLQAAVNGAVVKDLMRPDADGTRRRLISADDLAAGIASVGPEIR